MKKITVFLSATILIVALFAATAFKPMPPGPSANGQSTINPAYMNGIPQSFSFHANTNGAGNVTGSWESTSDGQGIRTHGRIDCLTVLPDGKTAIMTGVITKREGTGFPGTYQVGDRVWFKVVDNGEGGNNTSDQFTDYYQSDANCSSNFNLQLFNIIDGNVQVKP